MTIPSAEPTISRRVLAKGAAWAVPAAAAVAVAPAVAASPGSLSITAHSATNCIYSVTWQGKAGKSYKVEYFNLANALVHTQSPVNASNTGGGTDAWTSTLGLVTKIVVTILNETPTVTATHTVSPAPVNVTNVQMTGSGSTRRVIWTNGTSGATYNVSYTLPNGTLGSATNVTSPFNPGSNITAATVTMVLCGNNPPVAAT